MPPRDPQAVLEKLGQTTLKIDAFFLRRTGFIANQTVLKLDEYNLHCVPATLGIVEARFLAVLTPSEINLFSKFKAGIHILILTFDNPEMKDVKRFPLRVGLVDLVPVPERKNVCFLMLKFKSLPTEFILFLGSYADELEARQRAWETLAAQDFPFDAVAARILGLTGELSLCSGDQKRPAELVSFHTKRLVLQGVTGVAPGPVRIQMSFRDQQVVLEGTWDGQGVFLADFQPEWLDLVEDYQFHRQLKQKNDPTKGVQG